MFAQIDPLMLLALFPDPIASFLFRTDNAYTRCTLRQVKTAEKGKARSHPAENESVTVDGKFHFQPLTKLTYSASAIFSRLMQVDETDKNERRRMPRREFRKLSKLKRRREKRQKAAKEREENTLPPSDEEIKQKAAKDLADQLEYSRQKELWEEREKRYTMINIARKKALELEQEARAKAQKKWEEALRRIPMLPAEFEAFKEEDSKKCHIPKTIRRMPTFISSNDNETASAAAPKRRYKDLFVERKRKQLEEQESTATNGTS